MILKDVLGQEFGEGDIIIYATVSGSRPVLTRAEVIEIVGSKRIRVRPERGETVAWWTQKEFVWLSVAPIVKVASGTMFEEYKAQLLEKYEPLTKQEVH